MDSIILYSLFSTSLFSILYANNYTIKSLFILLIYPFLISRNTHNNKTIYHFRSNIPLTASSIGFVAGVLRKKQLSPISSVCAVIDPIHQYMIDYCVEVIKKAVTYLSTVFSHECVEHVKLLKSTSFVFVNEPPESYCITKNLVILDRDLLIGEKVIIE